jgi:Leucine-rich repeat (LRR) protein
MKKIKIIILIALISLPLLGNPNDFELGKRYLKLGNSYRESGNFQKAGEFLKSGLKLVSERSDFEGKYWTAVSHEYSGYLYRDMDMDSEAENSFKKALEIFDEIITMADGSPEPLAELALTAKTARDNIRSILDGNDAAMQGTVMNFSNMKLRNMPDGISEKVRNLSLSNNKFSDVPSGLYRLTGLQYLDLSGNKIKDVGMGITSLQNLRYLNLADNKIREIEPGISEMQSLEILNLENNRLKELPPGLCQLKNLRVLNLNGNRLEIETIMNLVKCLPETNITFDKYVREEEQEEFELFE